MSPLEWQQDPYLDGNNWTIGDVPHYTGPVTDEMRSTFFPATGNNRAWDRPVVPVGQKRSPVALQSANIQEEHFGPNTSWENLTRRQLEIACHDRTLGTNGTTPELIQRIKIFESSPLAQWHASLSQFHPSNLEVAGPQPVSASIIPRHRVASGRFSVGAVHRPATGLVHRPFLRPAIRSPSRVISSGSNTSSQPPPHRGRGRPRGTGKHQIARARAEKRKAEEEERSMLSDASGGEDEDLIQGGDDDYVPGPSNRSKKQRHSY